MEETLFTLDGEGFQVDVVKLEREFQVGQKENVFITLDGGFHREMNGTYYHYTMTVREKPGKPAELERFWAKISKPAQQMLCCFPYGQSVLEQEMYVTEGKQALVDGRGSNRWDTITVRFVGAKPRVQS